MAFVVALTCERFIDDSTVLVTESYKKDVFDDPSSFCGTCKDRFKALYWIQSNFLILYKRFEDGYMQAE
ncbi:hypothetical protein GRZ59_03120 [Lactobacillus paracasei]|nr:hypothetical protein [Lacticaseibacillus paracasei]QPC17899.1 IS66 family insertion sequence element accessory protein TnpB [Lacticaseibacillus paracasei subsp. tolerans]